MILRSVQTEQLTNSHSLLLPSVDHIAVADVAGAEYERAALAVTSNASNDCTKSPIRTIKTATILRNKKPTSSTLQAAANGRSDETRSQQAQRRESLSESDLLHEIDNALEFSRGFLYARGMALFAA